MTARIHIGTSGWQYEHWKGSFYPEKTATADMLDFYRRQFLAVEVNNSFYNLPDEKTLQKWCKQVPRDFVFAVKASRYLTHMKKLKDPREPVETFLGRIQALGNTLGPILFQLPPKWRCNPERLAQLVDILPPEYRYAFEFRDSSWFDQEVLDLLGEANAAFCIYDLDGQTSPKHVSADFVYIRLHGPGAAYEGSYGDDALAGWAGAMSAWAEQGKEIFCFFDNDQAGYAAANAARLQDMLGGE